MPAARAVLVWQPKLSSSRAPAKGVHPHTSTPPHPEGCAQLSFVRGNEWERELEVQLRTDRNHRRKVMSTPHCAMAVRAKAEQHLQQHSSCVLCTFCVWAKGSNFTQLLAAAENSLTGLLAFGSLSVSGLEGVTVIYHSYPQSWDWNCFGSGSQWLCCSTAPLPNLS